LEAYEPGRSAATYRRLSELAEQRLSEGQSVIVDATYRRARDRRQLRARLKSLGLLLFVECLAPPDVRLERAARRAASPSVSDADPRVASRLAAEFESRRAAARDPRARAHRPTRRHRRHGRAGGARRALASEPRGSGAA
jgi:uncharacterized protein